jgi:hypothetical protein
MSDMLMAGFELECASALQYLLRSSCDGRRNCYNSISQTSSYQKLTQTLVHTWWHIEARSLYSISAKRMYEENNYFTVYVTEFVFMSVEIM